MNFYVTANVAHNGQPVEVYRARNTALAIAQYELLEWLWNLKLNESTTMRVWATKNGYVKALEGVLEQFEIVEEKIGPAVVEITLRKKLDIEQVYKAIGKNHEPVLQREFTGVAIMVPRDWELYLMPKILDEDGELIVDLSAPLAVYESLLHAYESPMVGYVPLVVKATAAQGDKIVLPTSKMKSNARWRNILELMSKGRIVIVIEK